MGNKRRIIAFLNGLKGGKDNITKQDIVRYVAEETGYTQKATKEIIDATMQAIVDFCEAGGYITFKGFGVFYQTRRKGYTMKTTDRQRKKFGGKLPRTVRVPSKKVLHFKPSENLKK